MDQEEMYQGLIEAKAEQISVSKDHVVFKRVNHNDRAIKYGRLSDNINIAAYLNIALKN